jgi:hypothetical protein
MADSPKISSSLHLLTEEQAESFRKATAAFAKAFTSSTPPEDEPSPEVIERTARDRLTDEEVHDRKADRELRAEYAKKAFRLARCILIFWGAVVVLEGIWSAITGGKVQLLSDKALIAITAGATANVFAAFLGVIRGLFPGREKASKAPGTWRG